MRIPITSTMSIDEDEIAVTFVLGSGPGGQNVNKVATAAQLRFDARLSRSLPSDVKVRLQALAGSRLTNDGVIVMTARNFRSQERNRQAAIDRLVALIAEAAERPTTRRPTRPSRAAKQRRLDTKAHNGARKRDRSIKDDR